MASQQRQSGVLLHITSLPSPFAHGVLGDEALQWLDRLQTGGYRVWQFLPLGPTHSHGSPYESLSSSAGNPELIDLRDFVARGWLTESDLDAVIQGQASAADMRDIASAAFVQELLHDADMQQSFSNFQEENSHWLHDYALFTALKHVHQGAAWWQWSPELRDRDANALKEMHGVLEPTIQRTLFEQWAFAQQWQRIKTHAEHCGIQLFGDLPIYVAHDSSDVWANRDYFTVDAAGQCLEVAGVPPDYFSETGQRWGNPLYVWDALQASGFQWWVDRIRVQMERMHMIRIDHFRGLESFWAIPAHRDDGIEGTWRAAAGRELLQTLREHFGGLPLIAEDLGIITDKVTALRQDFGLPGMKILHFAFGGDAHNPYLPHNHSHDMVVYTGTHDNDTTLGWWQSAPEDVQQHVLTYLAADEPDIVWSLIRTAMASTAQLCIIPMQDLLELDATARFNTPGTLDNNWSWHMNAMPEEDAQCWQQSAALNQRYGRCG